MPITSIPQISPARIRSYILRLPFCTKVLVAAIVGLWVATIPFPWIRDFGALEPAKMDLTQSMFVLLLSEGYGRLQCLCCCHVLRRRRKTTEEESAEVTELVSKRRKTAENMFRMGFVWSSIRIMLIQYPCSASTELVPRPTLEFHPHDLQPLRRNTTYRALRVRIRNTGHVGAFHWA